MIEPKGAMYDAGIVTRSALMEELRLSDDTVREWEREGMPFIKKSSRVFYHTDSVVKWMLKHQLRGRK